MPNGKIRALTERLIGRRPSALTIAQHDSKIRDSKGFVEARLKARLADRDWDLLAKGIRLAIESKGLKGG